MRDYSTKLLCTGQGMPEIFINNVAPGLYMYYYSRFLGNPEFKRHI